MLPSSGSELLQCLVTSRRSSLLFHSVNGAATPPRFLGSSLVVICLTRTGFAFCVTVPSGQERLAAARQRIPFIGHTAGNDTGRLKWEYTNKRQNDGGL